MKNENNQNKKAFYGLLNLSLHSAFYNESLKGMKIEKTAGAVYVGNLLEVIFEDEIVTITNVWTDKVVNVTDWNEIGKDPFYMIRDTANFISSYVEASNWQQLELKD